VLDDLQEECHGREIVESEGHCDRQWNELFHRLIYSPSPVRARNAGMKVNIIPTANLALVFVLFACGNTDSPGASQTCSKLSSSVQDRFREMSGPLGCTPTTSLVPDPPDGCDGANALLATAKQEYATLATAGGCDGSPPDLSSSLAKYEQDYAASEPFVAHQIKRDRFTIAAREFGAAHAGQGPTVILMHGFPDDQHLYDRVAPLLGQRFQTITFDFVGWGASESPPEGYTYTVDELRADLEAVVAYFAPTAVVPVVHDASGWPGIDWALDNESRVAALVLLNTTYYPIDGLKPPYVIRALSANDLRGTFLDALGTDALISRALFHAQVGQFFSSSEAKNAYLPVLEASATKAAAGIIGLTNDLRSVLIARMANVPRMQAFQKPVLVAFGADDPFLNTTVAKTFSGDFPNSRLDLVTSAGHYVQLDAPDAVAEAIREIVPIP
jgi:pimeloyl-ACP methyl ester carboxylesterase